MPAARVWRPGGGIRSRRPIALRPSPAASSLWTAAWLTRVRSAKRRPLGQGEPEGSSNLSGPGAGWAGSGARTRRHPRWFATHGSTASLRLRQPGWTPPGRAGRSTGHRLATWTRVAPLAAAWSATTNTPACAGSGPGVAGRRGRPGRPGFPPAPGGSPARFTLRRRPRARPLQGARARGRCHRRSRTQASGPLDAVPLRGRGVERAGSAGWRHQEACSRSRVGAPADFDTAAGRVVELSRCLERVTFGNTHPIQA